MTYYRALKAHFAPRIDLEHWWPGRTRFEIVAGAILVQHTAWGNVEPALRRLRRAGALTPAGVLRVGEVGLHPLIRAAGCWRAKARCLHGFAVWLAGRYRLSLGRMFSRPTAALRAELLALPGIGEETADAILLYAGHHAVFVVDTYTRRIFERHGMGPPLDSLSSDARDRPYRDWQNWLEGSFGGRSRTLNAKRFREFHALLVETAKHNCGARRPDCARCPLRRHLPASGPLTSLHAR